jgi:hypothetical protein
MIRIRVYGQPAEVGQAVEELRTVFSVTGVSKVYQSRTAARSGEVRVYVEANLRDDVLVVAPPPPTSPVLRSPVNMPATEVRRGDRVLVPRMGWQRVVRIFPEPEDRPADLGGVFIWTRPNDPSLRWGFPPDELLRVMRLIKPGDFEEVPE